jgi:hypothetical protein
MADTKTTKVSNEDLAPGWESSADVLARTDTTAGGTDTTDNAPKKADQTNEPIGNDAAPDDPPVRAALPDTPIATTLATGAGAHVPVDDPDIGPDGRPSPRRILEASRKPAAGSPADRGR